MRDRVAPSWALLTAIALAVAAGGVRAAAFAVTTSVEGGAANQVTSSDNVKPPTDQTETVSFEIPAGSLIQALMSFQQQSGGRTIGVAESLVAKLPQMKTDGVSGALSPRKALERLLGGTGLTFLEDDGGGFTIRTLTSVYVPGGRCVILRDSCHEFVEQGEAVSFNVPAGDLLKALGAFKDQSGALAIRLVDAPVLGKESPGVSGLLQPREALQRLLSETNVTFLEDGYGVYYLQSPANVRVPGGHCVRDEDNRDICREQ